MNNLIPTKIRDPRKYCPSNWAGSENEKKIIKTTRGPKNDY